MIPANGPPTLPDGQSVAWLSDESHSRGLRSFPFDSTLTYAARWTKRSKRCGTIKSSGMSVGHLIAASSKQASKQRVASSSLAGRAISRHNFLYSPKNQENEEPRPPLHFFFNDAATTAPISSDNCRSGRAQSKIVFA